MGSLSSREIIKVMDALIGKTTPYGDSAVDEEREKNLMNLIDLVNVCLEDVRDVATCRHNHEASMRQMGEKAYSALMDWKSWLQEAEEELE